MDKLYTMSVFAKVVEMGSFTAVANHLDTTVGKHSRAVSMLEGHSTPGSCNARRAASSSSPTQDGGSTTDA